VRIAIDARLVGYVQGGTSQYLLKLLHALAALRTGDDLLVLEGRRAAPDNPWPNSAARLRLSTPPHHRLEQLILPLELLRVRADVLHSPDFIPPFRRRIPAVITIHDLAFLRFPHLQTPESARYYGQVRRAVQSAEQIIAVSESTRRDLLELVQAPEERITVVHSAAGPEYRPLDEDELEHARARLGLPSRFILFVGTIEPRKNLPVLLQAYAAMDAERAAPLVVVGNRGWLFDEVFRTRDELGLGSRVLFVGGVPAEQLVYYYSCASCLVLPSLYEGFGLPVIEAMACGTPVVVSNVSSLPEVAGDAAIAVSPDDVQGFADAMTRLLADDDLRRKLSELGLQRAREFSWERAAVGTLAVYRKAAEESR
jgi:glycosyltransferase involved in cell wall biosynthesis